MTKKINWKPGTMIYPLPATLVSCGHKSEEFNIITIAWTGTLCTDPPMCYISVRPERHSYDIIKRTGEFVINLTTRELTKATDWCGVRSGRDYDKFKEMKLTPVRGEKVSAPLIKESPINIECAVREIKELGSHHMFLADVLHVQASEKFLDENTGKFDLAGSNLISYIHGAYFETGRKLDKFGYSVRKKKK